MNVSFTCQDLQELENALENIRKMNLKSFPIKITLNSLHSNENDKQSENLGIECEEKEILEGTLKNKESEVSTTKNSFPRLANQKQNSSTISKEIDDFYLWYYYDGREEKVSLMNQAAALNVTPRLEDQKIILEGERSGVESMFKIITSLHYKESVDMKWDKADCVRRTSFFEKIKDVTKIQDRLRRHGTNHITDTVNLIIYGHSKEKVEYCVEQINYIVNKTAVLLTIPGINARKNEVVKIFDFLKIAFIKPIEEQLREEIEFKHFENQINQYLIFLFIDSQKDVKDVFDQLNKEMSCLCFMNVLQDEKNQIEFEPTPIQKGALNIFRLIDSSYILIGPLDVLRKNLKRLFPKDFILNHQILRYQFKGKVFDSPKKTIQLENLNSLIFCSQRDKKIRFLQQKYGIYCFRFRGVCEDVENILGKLEEIYEGLPLTTNDEEA